MKPEFTPPVVEVGGNPCMIDGKGRYTPIDLVKPEHRLEDDLVRLLFARAIGVFDMLSAFKTLAFENIDALQDLLAEKYGLKRRGGPKGNVTFSSYDGRLQVMIRVSDILSFGPELQTAKEICDECLIEWGASAPPVIRDLIQDAFKTGKAGQVARDQIFRLLRTEHDDPRWKKMQDALRAAIRVDSSKSYIHFRFRPHANANWITLTLDIAAVPLAGDERTDWRAIADALNLGRAA